MTMRILEKDIQKAILNYLNLNKIYAWINKTQGTWDPGKGIFRKNVTTLGISDILGVLPNGRILAIEVKKKGNKPTQDQKLFIENINHNGGVAFVARSIEDVEIKLKEYTNTKHCFTKISPESSSKSV